MGCSLVLPARPFWQARREFALLNGGNAAIEEIWNEAPFKNFVGRGPCVGIGSGRRSSGSAAATSAQAAVPGSDRRGKRNSGDEKRQRDVCQRGAQHRSADQGSVLAGQPQLSKGPPCSSCHR